LSGGGFRDRFRAARRAGDDARAEQAARGWTEAEPADADARAALADCLLRRGAPDEAEAALAGLPDPDGDDPRILRLRTVALYRQRKADAALPLAERLAARTGEARDAALAARVAEMAGQQRLFAERPFMDAYRETMDRLVAKDPHDAVGGLWEEVGRLQRDYLLRHGLKPDQRLLDLGCGTLRAGRHLIRYLDAGGYAGMDLSPAAIAEARALVDREGLAEKRPHLVANPDGGLTFREFAGRRFDAVLAQSVFTHLLEPHIDECFRHVGGVLAPGGRFFFTFAEADRFTRRSEKNFSYPFGFFRSMGARYGLSVRRMDDYDHPRGQIMAIATGEETR
jgi:SAM-dependent methyltransferase